MKALVCGHCGDIQALREHWRSCECGRVSARWIDPQSGTAEFKGAYPYAFMLGMNNHFLTPALQGATTIFEDARLLHEQATHAPGYVFDKSRAGCWAVIVRPGQTSDVTWHPPRLEGEA